MGFAFRCDPIPACADTRWTLVDCCLRRQCASTPKVLLLSLFGPGSTCNRSLPLSRARVLQPESAMCQFKNGVELSLCDGPPMRRCQDLSTQWKSVEHKKLAVKMHSFSRGRIF